MYKPRIILGVMPVKRGFLSMEEAVRQKERFMRVIQAVRPETVTLADVEGLCENGIASQLSSVPAMIERFRKESIDALFVPFCDFGEESVVAAVAGALRVPVLIWGNRDETVNTDTGRGRDTQCGMFAATKVLRRMGVTYSYIFNCETESLEFREGYERFLRVVNVLKDLRHLRIAKIGERPQPFMSVMANDAALLSRFGIVTVPIAPSAVSDRVNAIISKNNADFQAYYQDFTARIDCSTMPEPQVKTVAAVTVAVRELMRENDCSTGAIECWPTCSRLLGVPVCAALGELAGEGFPVSCETDVNGAVTMAMLRACQLGDEPGFLADLTVRHPANDNAELLWHCGPFSYRLKDPSSAARLVGGQERWRLKQGDLTLCRFDDIDGDYYLFAGEGRTTDGPDTTGTYVWFETDHWKSWEERLMFGPYIHHVGGMYGYYLPVLREAARYLGLKFETPESDGPRCL